MQVAQMLIGEVYKEMRLHGTLHEARRHPTIVASLKP